MTLKHPPWGEDFTFEWDDENEPHIGQHHITSFEVEECFENGYSVAPHAKATSEPAKYGDRYEVEGTTDGGRKLFIVVQHKGGNMIRPITAMEQE